MRPAIAAKAPSTAGRRTDLSGGATDQADGAAELWEYLFELTQESCQLAHSGDTVYCFVASLYPTDYPALPKQDESCWPLLGDDRDLQGHRPPGPGRAIGGSRYGTHCHRDRTSPPS